jgi:branched-chain amino acid transport system substrate-binding protein
MSTITRRAALAAAATLAAPSILRAQAAPLKIGLVTTLSGPGGYLGADIRDAMQLAVEQGALPGVQLLVEDDGLKPAQAKQIVDRWLKTEKLKLFTGVVFSNVMEAIAPDVLEEGAIYVSPNAGPSSLAGRGCHRNYYVVSWQNDTLHESAGENANRLGHKKVFVLAPNYPAGRDAITGFKRFFKGEIAGEIYTRLDQTDYAAEMAQIRAANPDAVFQFHPGGLGIAFIRQYQQAGLGGRIPMVVSSPSLDSTTLNAVGDAALGIEVSAQWNSDFDNPVSKKFVADFQAKYNRMPTYYARRHRGVPPRDAEGQLPGHAGQVPLRPEPAPGAGLVRHPAGTRGGRQAVPQDPRQGALGSRRCLQRSVQDLSKRFFFEKKKQKNFIHEGGPLRTYE